MADYSERGEARLVGGLRDLMGAGAQVCKGLLGIEEISARFYSKSGSDEDDPMDAGPLNGAQGNSLRVEELLASAVSQLLGAVATGRTENVRGAIIEIRKVMIREQE